MREIIRNNPILAILRNIPDEIVTDYAGAVISGGVSFFEVALNSEHAYEQISLLRRTYPKALIGAGTVTTLERARKAEEAGAQFFLSPSTNPQVLAYCRENGIDMLPGAFTPTDVSVCLEYGFSTIKLFPAGDLPFFYIKSLKGPFDGTEYVAIGGVSMDNCLEFFKAGYLGIGLASNLMPKELTARRDWEGCSSYVREFTEKVNDFRNGEKA